jgi:hypothetical protein
VQLGVSWRAPSRGVLESFVRASLGTYSQAGWESAMECNLERIERMPGSVLEKVLRMDLGASCELT